MAVVSGSVLGSSGLPHGPGCEALGEGFLTEPFAAVSSLAFVVAAGLALVIGARRASGDVPAPGAGAAPGSGGVAASTRVHAALVAGIGFGSFVQHGPDPWWSGVAHDVPLMGTLAFVAADGVADLTGRRRRAWWWLVPTVAVVPAALVSASASTAGQSAVAAVAIGVSLLRALRRPALRRPILAAVALLALGALVGSLSRAGGPLCDPRGLPGHAVWHVLAATALAIVTPAVGRR